jgi:hypothetical protein
MSQVPTPSDTTESQYEPVAEQPGWPKGIGIFSIIWGSLGALCGVFGVVSTIAAPALMKMGEQQNGPVPDVLKPPMIGAALAAVGTLTAVLLIIGGVMVLRRKPLGRILHLAYAVLSLLLTGGSIVVQFGQMQVQKQWVADNPGNKWAAQMHPELGLPMIAVMSLLSIAWPLFCILWFGIIKNKPNSMGVAVQKDYI